MLFGLPFADFASTSIEPDSALLSREFAAHFYSQVAQKMIDITLKYAGSKVRGYLDHSSMAAVCISESGVLTPIALATGSSMIYRKNITDRGRSLKDCQAEVLVLRATKRFILQQIIAFYNNSESIFQKIGADGRLQLKPDFGFHLFISRPPSGTCALLQASDLNDGEKPPAETEKLHILDGEIVSGNCHVAGTDVLPERTVADITDGQEKLQTMSSSDKIMKKMVTGVQGALAVCFTQPIFLRTVCVTNDTKPHAVARGIYDRLLPVIPTEKGVDNEFPLVCPEVSRLPALVHSKKIDWKEPLPMKGFVWYADSHLAGWCIVNMLNEKIKSFQ